MKKPTTRKCFHCNKILTTKYKIKFCSNKCQGNQKYKNSISKWKRGLVSGFVGQGTKVPSCYLRRYMFEKYKEKCSLCGWGEKHSLTNKVPLEIDHIDGNSENNIENNLRLLCPNCHSLTPYFRNLNKGNGRKWRMDKYIRNTPQVSTSISF